MSYMGLKYHYFILGHGLQNLANTWDLYHTIFQYFCWEAGCGQLGKVFSNSKFTAAPWWSFWELSVEENLIYLIFH